jgi:hypothetical protein
MGYEYRMHVDPAITDLADACGEVFSETAFHHIPTSFVDVSGGIGVQEGLTPADPRWPHVADLYLEESGAIFILCHCQQGSLFMNALVDSLRASRHTIAIEDV